MRLMCGAKQSHDCRYEEKMRAEGLRRLQDEPADVAADEPIKSIEVGNTSMAQH